MLFVVAVVVGRVVVGTVVNNVTGTDRSTFRSLHPDARHGRFPKLLTNGYGAKKQPTFEEKNGNLGTPQCQPMHRWNTTNHGVL